MFHCNWPRSAQVPHSFVHSRVALGQALPKGPKFWSNQCILSLFFPERERQSDLILLNVGVCSTRGDAAIKCPESISLISNDGDEPRGYRDKWARYDPFLPPESSCSPSSELRRRKKANKKRTCCGWTHCSYYSSFIMHWQVEEGGSCLLSRWRSHFLPVA